MKNKMKTIKGMNHKVQKHKEEVRKMDKEKKKKILTIILNTVLIILIVALTATAIFFIYKNNKESNSEEKTLSYTQLIDEVNKGNVEKIEMTAGSSSVKVKLRDVEEEKTSLMKDLQVMAFTELVQEKKLEGQDINLEVKQKSIISQIPSYIMSILPTAIMLGLHIPDAYISGKEQLIRELEERRRQQAAMAPEMGAEGMEASAGNPDPLGQLQSKLMNI